LLVRLKQPEYGHILNEDHPEHSQLRAISRAFGTLPELMLGRKRSRAKAARALFAEHMSTQGYSHGEIAELLLLERSTVSRYLGNDDRERCACHRCAGSAS
jgi:hypothetical protein